MGWASTLEAISEKQAELKRLYPYLSNPPRSRILSTTNAAKLHEDRIKSFLKQARSLMDQVARFESLVAEAKAPDVKLACAIDDLKRQNESLQSELDRTRNQLNRQNELLRSERSLANNELNRQNDSLRSKLELAKGQLRLMRTQLEVERRERKEMQRALANIRKDNMGFYDPRQIRTRTPGGQKRSDRKTGS